MTQINISQIKIDDYAYPLSDERIAGFPLEKRDESKLLLNKNGVLSEHRFTDLPDLLPENCLLVFNNTKVIQARLFFQKESGAQIEVFCLEPHFPVDYAQNLSQTSSCEWKCMVGNSKKWKEGKLRCIAENLFAERIATDGNTHVIRFSWDDPAQTFADMLAKAGELPIPPYLHRRTVERDRLTYQTVYSKIEGSVAAPTAGLHFTPAIFEALKQKKIETDELTLHVGAGTFQPVKSETIGKHTMHAETFSVSRSTIEHLLKKRENIVAVGTTSVRTLESLFYIGLKLRNNPEIDETELSVSQWEPYGVESGEWRVENESSISTEKALQNILDYLDRNHLDSLQTSTQIMIVPGYTFRLVRAVITNFHQPKSTLLLLVSAYLKGNWRIMYDYALAHNFRFLSYGDSSLLINEQ